MKHNKPAVSEPMELSADELELVVGGSPTFFMINGQADADAAIEQLKAQQRRKQLSDERSMIGIAHNTFFLD